MSETVHYKGILKRLEKHGNETLEDQCKGLLDNKELPAWYDTYKEFLIDEYYEKYIIRDGVVYRIEMEDVRPDSDIFYSKQVKRFGNRV